MTGPFSFISGVWSRHHGGGGSGTESPDRTVVTTSGPAINASPTPGSAGSGNLFTISSTGAINLNGVLLGGSGVIELYYIGHNIYQENSQGSWYGPMTSTSVGVNPGPSPVPTITGVTLTNSSFTGGAASGTTVGTIAVPTTGQGGTFIGTLALTGTDAAKFQIVGTSLQTSGTDAAGTYSINIVATQSGMLGSPFTQAMSITGTGVASGLQPAGVGITSTVYTPPTGFTTIGAGVSLQTGISGKAANGALQLLSQVYTLSSALSLVQGIKLFGAANGGTIIDGGGIAKGMNGQGVNNVVLSGITFRNFNPPGSGVGLLGTDSSAAGWTIQGCTITGIGVGPAIMLGNTMTIKDCLFNNIQFTGVGAFNCTGAIISHCEFTTCNLVNQSPFTATSSVAPIKIAQAINTQVRNNYIHDNISCFGFWADVSCNGTIVDSNNFTNNGCAAMSIEIDYGSTITNNYCKNNNNPFLLGFAGGGMYNYNAQNQTISGNTFEGNGGCLWFRTDDRGTGTNGVWTTANVNVHDNIFSFASGQHGDGGNTPVANSAFTFSNNHYHITGSFQLLQSNASKTSAAWQAAGRDTAASGATFASDVYTG